MVYVCLPLVPSDGDTELGSLGDLEGGGIPEYGGLVLANLS